MPKDDLQYLLDKSAVSDAATAFFMAVDRFDWDRLAELIADTITMDVEIRGAGSLESQSDVGGMVPRPVPRDEFIQMLKERNGGFTATVHANSGNLVTLDGDTAHVSAHAWTAHVVGSEPTDSFFGYGQYEIDLVRNDGRWLFSRFHVDVLGTEGDGDPADIFARAAARWAAGEGHR